MPDLIAAVTSAEAIDKSVGMVAKVVNKLKAQPDLAAQKLGQALEESVTRSRTSLPTLRPAYRAPARGG